MAQPELYGEPAVWVRLTSRLAFKGLGIVRNIGVRTRARFTAPTRDAVARQVLE